MSIQFAMGTYRISDQNPEHIEAVRTAVDAGVRMIDTSTNYMDGGAERAIALSLHRFSDEKIAAVEIVSKYGYLQGSTLKRIEEGETFPEIVKYAEHIYHCIAPEFMRDQLTHSLERLNRDRLDCYLIHNPEYFLLDALNRDADRSEMLALMFERIYRAFVALELEVKQGRIKSYGISSNSFSKSKDDSEFLPYISLMTLAEKAAKEAQNGKCHFTTIQLPINLLEHEGLHCAVWAKQNGLRVLANRPLNAQKGKMMYRLADYKEPEEYFHHLNELLENTEDERVKNLHNLIAQLDDVRYRFNWIGDYDSFLYAQVIPHIQKALTELDENSREGLSNSLNLFLQEYAKMVAYECSKKTHIQLQAELGECDKTLQECAIGFLQEQENIDFILVGMRKPSYVLQMLKS